MKKISLFLLAYTTFICIGTVTCSCAQSRVEKIDALIKMYADYGKFNGSVLVASHGKVIYKNGLGMANVEWGIPNQPNTKFRLASISKQFTAMAIVQLVAEGKLKLDEPISSYLPDYPKKNGDIITLHHLLTHSSGIPNFTSFPGYREIMNERMPPEELVHLFADSALEFTPGERFNYSNSGYVLLGYIIEKTTGMPYGHVVQNRIFTPLNMHHSGYDHTDEVIMNRASGYDRVGNTFRQASYIDMTVPFSAGGLYSTVEDMYLWDQALYTDQLLPKKYMDMMFKNYISVGDQFYGYGLEIGEFPLGNTDERIETIKHSGGINGFNTLATRIPQDSSFIILLNNTSDAPLYNMTNAIAGILYDKSYNLPKQSMAIALSEKIESVGVEDAMTWYQEVKDSNDYQLNENEMNTAGYVFLQSGRAREAELIFKLNVKAYPNAFNPYDSYGEALLVLGDTVESIKNYKKSIQLNPGNQNGINVLKKLGVKTDDLIYKVSVEYLQLLEGEYNATEPPGSTEWKIVFTEENGVLFGNDKGYRYRVLPVGDNQFVNPDDGASLVFDTNDKNAITLMLFGKYKFSKEKL